MFENVSRLKILFFVKNSTLTFKTLNRSSRFTEIMDFLRMCRVCMKKDNLTSIFSIMDGEKLSDKLQFVCGITVSKMSTLKLSTQFSLNSLADHTSRPVPEAHLPSLSLTHNYRGINQNENTRNRENLPGELKLRNQKSELKIFLF
jgi:hypothetical protein